MKPTFIREVEEYVCRTYESKWKYVYFAAEGLVVVSISGEQQLFLFFNSRMWTINVRAGAKYDVTRLDFGSMVRLRQARADNNPSVLYTLADDFIETGDQRLTILPRLVCTLDGLRT